MAIRPDQADHVRGSALTGVDGVEIGPVEDLYVDSATRAPEWAAVTVGDVRRYVPLREATSADSVTVVPYTLEQVASAPLVEAENGRLTETDEDDLYEHFGLLGLEPGQEEPRNLPPRASR